LQATSVKAHTGLWNLFITFLTLGIQSFGGGSSTLIMIHNACIKYGWMGEEEFVRTYALVQIAPGINLIKLTMLIGKQLRGWPGLFSATAGLLLPSASVTVLMTAGYTVIRNLAVVQSALKGILPATIGLGLAMAVQMVQPLVARAYREGPVRLGANLCILVASAVLLGIYNASPVVVMLASGGAAVAIFALVPVKVKLAPAEKPAGEESTQ
jgi:chromate transporter